MTSSRLQTIALLVLWIAAIGSARENQPKIWGGLTPGPYPVGYRISADTDYGRLDVGSGPRRFRPVVSAVWYPSVPSANAQSSYATYLDAAKNIVPEDFGRKLAEHGRNGASQAIAAKNYSDLSPDTRTTLDQTLAATAYATLNEPPAAGQFPVVLYHAGSAGSFEENSVLFEFLASNGYVVISSAYQFGTRDVSNSVGGAQKSIQDMKFLLNAWKTSSFIDPTRVAAIGHSAGAQHVLEWIGEADCPLRAMVSLDTTLEYTPARFKGHHALRRRLEDLNPPRIPTLLFATAERHPNFATFDRYLQFSDRYEASVAGLRHDDYITHGIMRHYGTADDSAASVARTSYKGVCDLVLRFLDAYVKSTPGRALNTQQALPGISVTFKQARVQ